MPFPFVDQPPLQPAQSRARWTNGLIHYKAGSYLPPPGSCNTGGAIKVQASLSDQALQAVISRGYGQRDARGTTWNKRKSPIINLSKAEACELPDSRRVRSFTGFCVFRYKGMCLQVSVVRPAKGALSTAAPPRRGHSLWQPLSCAIH